MRRFFSFRSSTANAASVNAAPPPGHSKNEKALEEDESDGSYHSPDIPTSRSRSFRGELKNKESSNPQLRRCLSFSSPATNRLLEELNFSFSDDLPCSMSNNSDAHHHVGDVNCYTCLPERHPAIREYMIKVPKPHGINESDSPGSRCYSSSTGHSPVSSPVALRCRPARLTNLLDQNEVLDLYIDGEQEATRLNDKQKQRYTIRTTVSNLGRPPRPQSTVPSSPKSTKDILKTYPNMDVKDVFHYQVAQEGIRDAQMISSLCNASRDHANVLDAFSENLPHLEDYKSESLVSVEDIYEDLQDVQPSNFLSTSTCPISEEQEADEKLLRRAREMEMRFKIPSGDNYEVDMLRDKSLSSADMFRLIQSLTEDRKQLALELSSQIKARLTERFSAKEQYKQSKIELETRTRRLEKEKIEVQTTLERELDRRSNDWSVKLVRFQCEEQRLRERVRELAEQNVSFQREVTFLEANKADASNKIASLEMQNRELNDELQKVRNEHDSLHSSSMELHDCFTKAAEEKDHILGVLREKEDESKALQKVIGRLQRTCNEQEKTITGLRQGYNVELDKNSAESSDNINRMQMELTRLTGVEQKLRREVQSCTLEIESLRQENIAILNRLQSSENGLSFSSICLDQELSTSVDNLQIKGLSLLDDTSQLCGNLLDLIKRKWHENEPLINVDALTVTDYTLNYQGIKGRIVSLKQSLRTIESVLDKRGRVKEKTGDTAGGGSPPRQQKDEFSLDNFKLKLKEEGMLNRVLKEALFSKELDLEELQSDLAASVRIQYLMKNEIQRVQDDLSCLTHKFKHLELQCLKKDERISQMKQGFQEAAKELTALQGALRTVTDERDLLWQEATQLRKTISTMQNDIASLKKKIESLDEDIMVKEGQISILRDSMDKPFDFICSPMSMKQLDME